MIPLHHTIGAVIGAAAAALIVALPAVSMETLSLDELDEVRAGFSVGGITIADVGVVLEATIDGTLASRTTSHLTDQGLTIANQLGDIANILPLNQATNFGIDISNFQGDGVVVQGVGGATAVIQTLNDSQIHNLVVNTAQDRTIIQQTQLTFVIPNLPDLQQSMQVDRIRAGLDAALTASLISALR